MNCKVSRSCCVSSGVCIVLDSASTQTNFRQVFCVKFYVRCNWNFGGFLKAHIAFYKHILNINNRNDAQHNYPLIELLLNFLAAFFVEKTKFLSIFFSNSEFGMCGEMKTTDNKK